MKSHVCVCEENVLKTVANGGSTNLKHHLILQKLNVAKDGVHIIKDKAES